MAVNLALEFYKNNINFECMKTKCQKIFGCKEDGVNEQYRILHSKEL
jgi:hypothetical protein